MNDINPNELLTVSQAARLKGVSRQWIARLIQQGRLSSVEIAGRSFVRQQDVLGFKSPPKTGRPLKKDISKKGSKKR